MQSQEPTLREIVDDAYRVFARYPRSDSFVVCHCSCCMTEAVEAELVATPLREIPSRLLAEYSNSAHGWDDNHILADMCYLLPRYLELISADDVPSDLGIAQCLNRLADAKWRDKWLADEIDILDRFFDAMMVHWVSDLHLLEWPVGWRLANEAIDALSLAVKSGGDIDRVLSAWDAAADPAAVLHMAAAREHIDSVNGVRRFVSPYLDNFVKEAVVIAVFLDRPEVDERLEAIYPTLLDERLRKIVARATNWV